MMRDNVLVDATKKRMRPTQRAAEPRQRAPGPWGGYAARFLSFFLALSEFRFDGESTLPPQVPLRGITLTVGRAKT
jgi:hypothetical protein